VLPPHIAGRVAYLMRPGATSYAESVMGLVEHYHLGEIVGSATAGPTATSRRLPSRRAGTRFSPALRVIKCDRSRFHLIGVQPTMFASRTIAGAIADRDDVLEKALTYVR
jgi:hypothetical protein